MSLYDTIVLRNTEIGRLTDKNDKLEKRVKKLEKQISDLQKKISKNEEDGELVVLLTRDNKELHLDNKKLREANGKMREASKICMEQLDKLQKASVACQILDDENRQLKTINLHLQKEMSELIYLKKQAEVNLLELQTSECAENLVYKQQEEKIKFLNEKIEYERSQKEEVLVLYSKMKQEFDIVMEFIDSSNQINSKKK